MTVSQVTMRRMKSLLTIRSERATSRTRARQAHPSRGTVNSFQQIA